MNIITLIKISWRNVWRSKLRSFVVIMSVIFGILGGIIMVAMSYGLNEERMNNAVETYLSHIQIHNKSFSEDYNIKHTINNLTEIEKAINNDDRVTSYSKRIILNGMLSNSNGSYGIQVKGINPSEEIKVTNTYNKIIEGEYFKSKRVNTILVGKKLADRLNLKIKSKVVITFQDENNELISLLYRVEGIFRSGNSRYDEANVFVRNLSIAKNLPNFSGFHEVPILLTDIELKDEVKNELIPYSSNNIVESWDDISIDLAYANEMLGAVLYIFMMIILTGLSFGIVNTMLMAILERKREIGMLMSIGMSRYKIFLMICFETIFLSLVALPFGLVLSYFIVEYYSVVGIDLSIVAAGLENFGVGTRLYFKLPNEDYFVVAIMVFIISIISSIFPSVRALKINPVEATKTI
ncbi:MAG TPA: ABC transporter permease [Cytophagales bacterium]|jgi:ABC-type lipoprotein release transport system permease subunit|nr:ABC transporter permease [Cytophagales bacterium]